MSGHSKFHTIAKKKGATDSMRAVQFGKLGKLITVAARDGGGDPAFNFQLRVAIDQAKEGNMPKDNIERAIKRGTGEDGAGAIVEIIYEGFGPGGSAMLIKSLTDNRNRSISEIRTAITKNNGTMAGQGSVAWMFEKKGVVTIVDPSRVKDRDVFELAVIDAGADDIIEDDGLLQVLSPPDQLKKVLDGIEALGVKVDGAEIEYRAKEFVALENAEGKQQFEKLMEVLDELEDVDTVYTNVK
ncbi:MAG: YebC/PmpR family DNA-binding transcriptional regulator [Candidatus Uhrbacteria bacterium]|nr:YebC/PmpR family DNA-binding transcriptional regulator [Candidatus Uhrbacteria bacterium]